MEFDITVDLYREPEGCDIDELERLAIATLAAEGAPQGTAVAITVLDDDWMQDLNRHYRGLDAPTDVLAFALYEGEPLVSAPGVPPVLGDVVISIDTAQRQAQALGHGLAAELALLTIHGCLHLLGYDHDEPEAQERMWARQAAILAACGYPDVGRDRPEMCEQADDA
jgi:probable rRNA maturation factor